MLKQNTTILLETINLFYSCSQECTHFFENLEARWGILNDLYVKKENFRIIILKMLRATMKNFVTQVT
jgi:hypothetical protein